MISISKGIVGRTRALIPGKFSTLTDRMKVQSVGFLSKICHHNSHPNRGSILRHQAVVEIPNLNLCNPKPLHELHLELWLSKRYLEVKVADQI